MAALLSTPPDMADKMRMKVGAVSASLAGLGGGEGGRSLEDLIDAYRLMIFDF